MASIQITSTNYNGQTAQVTFYSVTAPSTAVNLGPQTLPYSRSGDNVYGSYELNFTAYNKVCVVALNGPTTTTTTTTTTTAAPECCTGDLYLSGPGIPVPGCYAKTGSGWELDTRVYDENGDRVSGSVFYAYISEDGYTLNAYDFMDFTWSINVILTGGPSANLCPKTGTHPTGQGSTVTIGCGCPTYCVTGASDSSYNGTYVLAGTQTNPTFSSPDTVQTNYYKIDGQERYMYRKWDINFGSPVWYISNTLNNSFSDDGAIFFYRQARYQDSFSNTEFTDYPPTTESNLHPWQNSGLDGVIMVASCS